jgi:hypothetical protein
MDGETGCAAVAPQSGPHRWQTGWSAGGRWKYAGNDVAGMPNVVDNDDVLYHARMEIKVLSGSGPPYLR